MYITKLTTQNLRDPLGIGCSRPAFGYSLQSERRGDGQSAYQIMAASSKELLEMERADLWDSNKVEEENNYALYYQGVPLRSRQEVYWRVRVWDIQGVISDWSETAWFEMGLLEEDWEASWIGQGDTFDGDKSAAPALAGRFLIEQKETLKKARLYISGLGLFAASMNGKALSDSFYEPGESEYNRRVYYVTYDVISFLQEGENVLGVLLGNGQYVNYAVDPVMKNAEGILSEKHRYQKDDSIFLKDGICGDKKMIARLELTRTDGTLETALVSDGSWKIGDSPITFQNWYGGEDYDGTAALRMRGFDTPEADYGSFRPAAVMQPPLGELTAKEFLPVRIWERWKPKSVSLLPNGNWLVDMGKNSAGFVRLKLYNTQGYAGRKIEMYPAEVLKDDGSGVDQGSCTQSCSSRYRCAVKDSYIVAGTGCEQWHPLFVYHGFQYVEITGFPGTPSVENFEGCAVRMMNEKTSSFETDNEILNQIMRITDRAIESNMMFSFTDCPQIEKLGWLETTHLMFASMASGYDIRSWIPKIVRDMRDAQVTLKDTGRQGIQPNSREYPGFDFTRFDNRETEEPGFVPGIAPEYFRIGRLFKDPNWGGACVMTSWYYYWEYGDKGMLWENFPMMDNYMGHLERQSCGGVLKGYAQMGEWGQLQEETPVTLVATCAFYLMAATMREISGILGKEEQKERYSELALRIRIGFHEEKECYNSEKEIYGNGSQASYGCVIFSGIAEGKRRDTAVKKMLEAVAGRDDHLSSGEVGLKQVFIALASAGHNDVVFRMVMNKTQPSYRYYVDQGLTTLPEYWDYTRLRHGNCRSRNHAMMGHVKEWLGRYVLGIMPLSPGYKKLRLKPFLAPDMQLVKGAVYTVQGRVRLECVMQEEEQVFMLTEIPCGAEAEICIPCSPGKKCFLDDMPFGDYEVTGDGYLSISRVLSGTYKWTIK